MNRRRLLVLKLLAIFVGPISGSHCDRSTTAQVEEGNLGQTSDFNWLGVLRVHIHDDETVQVAVTGIVLIKTRYALANADDIVRIPKRIFLSDSQAMFLGVEDTPWYCKPVSYVTHPEYEYRTYNSIAIVQLNIEDAMNYPLNPICFPNEYLNTSNHLYLTGYTDENQLLEKVIYKIQYIPKESCEEFYNRAGLSAKNRVPTSYICGFSQFNKTQCVWDNGMALVSNVTGWFTLIGFGIRGPGCAAPARFIDLNNYFTWINSITTLETEMYDSPDYRRDDGDVEFIPTHDLFRAAETRRENGDDDTEEEFNTGGALGYLAYPFDVEKLKHFEIKPHDDHAIAIFPFDDKQEMHVHACEQPKVLMYAEIFELHGNADQRSVATYKLSMYDKINQVCVCVLLNVDAISRSDAILSFKEQFDYGEGTQLTDSSETPEELFRYYPITERNLLNTTTEWTPNANYKPQYLKGRLQNADVVNYDLYIKFEFIQSATLKFELYAKPIPRPTAQPDNIFRRLGNEKSVRVAKKKNNRSCSGKKKLTHRWGMQADSRVREPGVTVVVDQAAVVQETVSSSCCRVVIDRTIPKLVLQIFVWLHIVLSYG